MKNQQKIKTKNKVLVLLMIAFLGILITISKLSPEDKKTDYRTNAYNESIDFALLVKRMTKDPNSFDLLELRISNSSATCLRYRATNSFGAYIESKAVKTSENKIHIEGMDEDDYLWMSHCADGTGSEVPTLFSGL